MGFVDYEVNGQVGVITINRPKALNALNSEVLDDLNAVFDGVDQNEVRCLVLTGAGDKSFVAGADIGEMSTLTKEEGEAVGIEIAREVMAQTADFVDGYYFSFPFNRVYLLEKILQL